MKAMTATGRTEPSVALTAVDQPQPRPDEALVKVEAYSVNRGETFQLEAPRPGWRPGKDVAGLVVQAAADGSGPAVGARVVGHPPQGGWAEYVAVPTSSLADLPDTVPAATAAALPLAGLTALRLLRVTRAAAGSRVLMTGASGGVGHYFVELAAAAGLEITAVSSSPERGARLLELGAARVVPSIDAAEGPFDIVLESTGGPNLPAALAKLARRGTLIWFGQASRQPATLDFFDFFAGPESATIRHFHYADSDSTYGQDLQTLVRLVAADRLHPEIGLVTDWTGTADVLTLLRDRGVRGNAVLTIA
ncbi:Alcohol dehydrogenase zinc-binding domain protein [Catenulispora acidiphila DSM 44928]|uniref:Alcohol dehydrogenase zinc-binding domain protein n=1 Tax=Catenulispora acidiphila (strain DSM 44928 / JCM 14897 / NBRC 102108 / NRRL B-24433 / ID139908) TaxID=479433 RepID=C7PVH2_CATAD|nr:zinc-binding dehydrogenase [Catenulispora acidiphila]ACU69328.1 Alcohol dehydrogenase zinc-binding domain protein [Catenulispora acidiphila DSM 44928]